MKRLSVLIAASFVAVLLHWELRAQGSCGLQLGGTPAICETFDQPAGIGNRSGDLNGTLWGVSRLMGNDNFGQNTADAVSPVTINLCNGQTSTVLPPRDVQICNGQVHEATNDNGTVTVLAMYPKQPFDFAGRTGTIAVDVSNDTHGVHATWPEIWVTDTPDPAPFTHLSSELPVPKNGVGVRFAALATPGQYGACPNFDNTFRWTVDSIAVSRNYVVEDSFDNQHPTNMALQQLDCVVASPDGSFAMNHIEVQISQNQIDVYATDAGTVSPLKHIAAVTNVNLGMTRGLVWMEDAHYSADKGNPPIQTQHTFAWDNLAFDGPVLPRDLTFDAPDNTTMNPDGTQNLGQIAQPGGQTTWIIPGLPSNPSDTATKVLFDFFFYTIPNSLTVTVNGNAHTVSPSAIFDATGFTYRTLDVTIPITDLVAGTNSVQIGSPDQEIAVANVDLLLAGAGSGGGPPPPPPPSPPTAPTGFQAAPLVLTWTANPASQNVTAYEIDYGTRTGVHPNHLSLGNVTSATITGLTPHTKYFWVIKAFNGQWGPPSAELTASTP